MQARKIGYLFGLLLVMLTSSLLLTGCGGDEANAPQEPAIQKPSRTTRIEMRDPKTGELSRTHVYDENGVEVETQIAYRNGEKGVLLFRKDKTAQSLSIYAKAGHLRQQIDYHADGKLAASTRDFRNDGTLLSEVTINADETESSEKIYWFDGKRLFSERQSTSEGQSLTYYRKDGSVWVKHIFNRWTLQAIEEYGPGGKLEMKREIGQIRSQLITTVYRADGTVRIRYTSRASWGGPFSSWTYLRRTEQMDAAGNVTRAYDFELTGSTVPTIITDYNPDGTSKVRYLFQASTGTVIREEVRDANGVVLSTTDTEGTTLIDAPLDPSLIATPTPRDPQSLWQLQERDPNKRNDPDA